MTLLDTERATAVTAPAAAEYTDPTLLRAELAAAFRRSWQVAVPAAAVAEPGSYAATTIAGTPVVVTRDQDGVLHALANVCRHRGMILAEGCGPARNLVCPNHAWVYDLSGRLVGAPRTGAEPGFDPDRIALPRLAVHEWGPLVLANLDGAAEPPRHELDVIETGLAESGLRFADLAPYGATVDWSIEASWKIVVENYLECYHCGRVHPDLARVIDTSLEKYALDPDGDLLSARSPIRSAGDPARQQQILRTDGPVELSQWHLLFPATTINVYPGQGAVEVTWYWPVDTGLTAARTLVLAPPGADPAYLDQVVELLTRVGEEDNAICESMHAGLLSGTLERPMFLAHNEKLLGHFHAALRARLGAGTER